MSNAYYIISLPRIILVCAIIYWHYTMFQCICFIQECYVLCMRICIATLSANCGQCSPNPQHYCPSASPPQPLKILHLRMLSILLYTLELLLLRLVVYCNLHCTCTLNDKGNDSNLYIISIFPFPEHALNIYSTNRKWWNSSCSYRTTSYHLYWSRHFGYHGAAAPDCINTSGLYYQKVSFNT